MSSNSGSGVAFLDFCSVGADLLFSLRRAVYVCFIGLWWCFVALLARYLLKTCYLMGVIVVTR